MWPRLTHFPFLCKFAIFSLLGFVKCQPPEHAEQQTKILEPGTKKNKNKNKKKKKENRWEEKRTELDLSFFVQIEKG